MEGFVVWLAIAIGLPLLVLVAIFLYNLWLTVSVREAWEASWISAWRVFKRTFGGFP